jgi:voltage-gated potassium channel
MNPQIVEGQSVRARTFEILETGRRGDRVSRAFNIFIVTLILANVTGAVLVTAPSINAAWGPAFDRFDWACVVIFAVEYLARLWTAPHDPRYRNLPDKLARLRLAATPLMILDLIAILPTLIAAALGINGEIFRVLRVVRFFRFTRYVMALQTIGRVLGAEWRRLAGTAVLFLGLLLVSGALMFIAEGDVQPDKMGSIPLAMWWAVVTLSTVGYGDVVPVTTAGKMIAGLTMATGIMFFALPVAVIASGFQEEIKRRDFVVSFAMVARVPLFSGLGAAAIAQLAAMLTARKVPGGTEIVVKDDEADGMYFIVSGRVEVELPGAPVRLGEGDFFGEIAMVNRARRTATVRTLQPTELLKLSERDFRVFMDRNPLTAETVRAIADRRLAEIVARRDIEAERP